MRFLIGDLLTGKRIKWLSPLAGSWSEVLNSSGEIRCKVLLSDPDNATHDLFHSAAASKSFLAAVEGDVVLQAGPIWVHDWDENSNTLELAASGMWGYFDHRLVLPVLAGRNPADPTTDTRFWPVVSDPNAEGYPWVSDTRKSLQGIARFLVWQAQQHTGGNVPVVLPDEIAGSNERWYRGADLAVVGQRLRDLTDVDGGPDVMFTPRFTEDKQGIEWVMRIGTPSQPLLFSPQEATFHVGLAGSSVSDLKVHVDGTRLAARGFAAGGRSQDVVVITESNDPTLPDAGYALLERADTTHATASEVETLQGYSDELVVAGRTPDVTYSFQHDVTQIPYVGSFNAGDFARVRVHSSNYVPKGSKRMRLLQRSGQLGSSKVALSFTPEVV